MTVLSRLHRVCTGAALLAAAAALSGCAAGAGVPVAITARPMVLAPEIAAPGLRFLGALDLTSADPHFGGLSALRWHGGRLHAVSDKDGAWYALRLHERGGRLVGLRSGRTVRLLDSDGEALVGKRRSDAEALDFVDARSVLVALERDHRVLRYPLKGGMPSGRPQRLAGMDDWLRGQPDNEGIESMASDGRGTLLVSEGLRAPDGGASAIYVTPPLGTEAVRNREAAGRGVLSVPAPGAMRPSDLVATGPGRFVMLRRSWSEASGFAVVVEELTVAGGAVSSRPLLRLAPPVVSENFEGVAVRRSNGRAYLYVIADDNFEPGTRTLLLKFELVEDPA